MKASVIFVTAAILSYYTLQPEKQKAPDHIIIVVEENHGYDQVIGSKNAPYLNQLAKEGALFTDAHGVTHPSQPNYLALFSGSTQGVFNDDCNEQMTYHTPNLGAALLKTGHTFKGFSQGIPEVGFKGCYYLKSKLTKMTLYARKHCPWVNWQGIGLNNIPDSLSVSMTSFPKDFNKLPTVSFVIPDMDHDMHNIGAPGDAAAIFRSDSWLKENLNAYAKWAKLHNSLLIVTFDEDDFKTINHIPTIIVGENVIPGKYDQKLNHYNVLHTIESFYKLPMEDSTKANVITDVWAK
ncbi:phospholipase C [Pedobacter sp. UYEF25]